MPRYSATSKLCTTHTPCLLSLFYSTLAKEISQLNMEAGRLSVELNAVRAESRELSEGVRRVEEEVGVWRRERERESRTRVADLHTEAIRLRRELEVF